MGYRRLVHPAILEFGYRVRERRLAAGLSQSELARRSRMTRKCIGEIERGTSNPTLETMVLVAAGLRCDLVLGFSDGGAPCVVLDAVQARRASAALVRIASTLTPKKRSVRDGVTIRGAI